MPVKEHQREIANLRRRARRRKGREARCLFMAEVIQEFPEHFDMSSVVEGPGIFDDDDIDTVEAARTADLLHCGTTGCIAGWSYFLWPGETKRVTPDVAENDDWISVGADLLELTHDEASDLFLSINMSLEGAVEELQRLATT